MLSSIVKSRRGISEMVSYVMLIVIALGLSVLVYNYLVNYVPKDKVTCSDDISVTIKQIACNSTNERITFEFLNNGLFDIDFLYVRIIKENQSVGQNIAKIALNPALNPSLSSIQTINSISQIKNQPGKYSIELQPAVWIKKQLALCENSVYSQQIQCAN